MGDFLPGYEATTWGGVGAPKNTSAEIVEKLNREINSALADPKIIGRFADPGAMPFVGSPADFGMLIAKKPRSGAGGQVRGHQAGMIGNLHAAGWRG